MRARDFLLALPSLLHKKAGFYLMEGNVEEKTQNEKRET